MIDEAHAMPRSERNVLDFFFLDMHMMYTKYR